MRILHSISTNGASISDGRRYFEIVKETKLFQNSSFQFELGPYASITWFFDSLGKNDG